MSRAMWKVGAALIAVAIWALASESGQAHGCLTSLPDGRVVVTPALVGANGFVCPPLLLLPNGTRAVAPPARTFARRSIGPFTTGNIGPFTTDPGPFTTGEIGPFTTGTPAGTPAPFTIIPNGRGMPGKTR